MTRRRLMFLFGASALVLCSACKRSEEPEEPVWGKQPCAHCAMIVADSRYAAQVLMEDGSRSFFDDIGCMTAFLARSGPRLLHAWVHDEGGPHWLPAASARYRRGARTPMDYGFVAGTTGDLGFEEVKSAVLARGRDQ